MKHFLVTDDQGNPVFVDSHFDVDQARMLCLPFAITQDLVESSCHEKFTAMRCGQKQFVFTQYDELLYLVVSDEGESVPFLRRQLQLIHELLQFKFGPKPDTRSQMHRTSSKFTSVLRPLIHTMTNLGSTQQSYLVQSIERLEVNDDLRSRCMRSLEEACATHRGHGAAHVLLFVGTKLVSHYSRSENLKLHPSDIFLLSLYIKSLQEPAKPEPQPAAPFESFVSPNEHLRMSDEEFVLAREDADDGADDHHQNNKGSSDDGANHDDSDQQQQQPQQPDIMDDFGNDDQSNPTGDNRPSMDSDSHSQTIEEQPELCVFEKLFLRTPTIAPRFVYMGQVAPLTTMVVVSDTMKGTEQEKAMMTLMQQSIKRSLSNFIDFLIMKEMTHMTVLSFLSHFPGLVHFIYVDRLNHQVIAPVIVPLDNETDPAAAAAAAVAAAAAGGLHDGEDDDAAQLAAAQTAKSSPDQVRSQSTTPNPQQDPASQQQPPQKPEDIASFASLKRRVWEMVFSAQDRLSQGYTSMIMQSGMFQFAYHLWFEDLDGNVLQLDQPVPLPETSFDGSFYRDMTKKLFPNLQNKVNCYELYSMHLALVPSRTVVNHNRRLIRKLREGRVPRRPVI